MNNKELITINDSLTLLQDEKRVFLIQGDGSYMSAEEMKILAAKMLNTATKYGSAIESYNKQNKYNREVQNAKSQIEFRRF